MRVTFQFWQRILWRLVATAWFVSVTALATVGQSIDVGSPTPVYANEITGQIAPRDVGDARLTRHFYTFSGREGDLIVTVESTSLNGDVDLYTASTLRPLAKVTLYAGSSATTASKSVYLRREEAMVLRVEARSAGDAEGTYRIRFAGAFVASTVVSDSTPSAESVPSSVAPPARSDKTARRASATGARLPETEEEKAARIEMEAKERAEKEAEAERKEIARREAAERKENARREAAEREERVRGEAIERRASAAAARRATRVKPPAIIEPASPKPTTTPPRRASAPRRNSRRGVRSATRENASPGVRANTPAESVAAPSSIPSAAAAAPAPESQPAGGARLILETRDGLKLERNMATVRRVTIENNQIVIVNRNGIVERQPLTNILRMSIEP